MVSFWEKRSFCQYDYIVIGSGIVGLSAAIAIKEKRPDTRVIILEKGIFPSGASTKNAGFACFGSLTELIADLDKLGKEQVVDLVYQRWKGLKLLRNRLGDKVIDFKSYGGFELLNDRDRQSIDKIDEVNDLLFPLFNQLVFLRNDQLIDTFGFNRAHISALVANPLEGQLDTGKMMKGLIRYAMEAGIEMLTGAKVNTFVELADGVEVEVAVTDNSLPLTFKSQFLAICTNAFTKQLVPSINLQPGRGQVLVTRPIPNLPFKGTFYMEEGFYYFRNIDNRILLGGGRNLDLKGESTIKFENTPLIMDRLHKILTTIIIPEQEVGVEGSWSGIMAFGENKRPIVEKISDRIVLGVRLGGMGVAIGSQVGNNICQLIIP